MRRHLTGDTPQSEGTREPTTDPSIAGLIKACDIAYRKWCARRGKDPDDVFEVGRGPRRNRKQKAHGNAFRMQMKAEYAKHQAKGNNGA